MKILSLIVGLSLLACGLSAELAAQTAVQVTSTTIDVGPLINTALAAIGTGLTAVVFWAIKRVTGVQLDDRAKAVVETAMQNGLAFAKSRAGITGEIVPVNLKSQVLATALGYVAAHAPDAAKRLGVDLRDPSALRQQLEARLARRELHS